MSKALELLRLLEDTKFDVNLISDMVKKLTSDIARISRKHKVQIKTNLDKIEHELVTDIKDMPNQPPEDTDLDFDIHVYYEEDLDAFKSDLVNSLQSYIDNLKELKKRMDWVHVEKLVKPYLAIEYKS